MTTLAEALETASNYWPQDLSSGSVMNSRAKICAAAIGGGKVIAEKLTQKDAVKLLTYLRDTRKLSPKSVADYYQTFRRVLTLSGVRTDDWPKPFGVPRRTRDAVSSDDFERVLVCLSERGHDSTRDLAILLRYAGLRVRKEALSGANTCRVGGDRVLSESIVFRVTGKGGHERQVPVVEPRALHLLDNPERMEGIHSISYHTHLRRWNAAIKACNVKSRLASFHALRHTYCTEALKASGGNLALVQDLMGHSSIQTTAGYLHVSMEDKIKALGVQNHNL